MRSSSFCLIWVFVAVADAVAINSSLLDGKISFGEIVPDMQGAHFMGSIRLLIESCNDETWLHICGGCLISEEHVLSAAQCIFQIRKYTQSNLKKARVFFGHLKLNGATVSHKIKNIDNHRDYNPDDTYSTGRFDIGVISLRSKVEVSDRIKPIDMLERGDVDILYGTIMGWGSETHSKATDVIRTKYKEVSNKLRSAYVRIEDQYTCSRRLLMLVTMEPTMLMCGFGRIEKQQVSVGDAGNPFIFEHENKNYVAGIVSYMPKSGTDYPNLIVRISGHAAYIQEAMTRTNVASR